MANKRENAFSNRANPDAERDIAMQPGCNRTAVALEARAVERARQAWQKVKAEVLGWVEGKAKVEESREFSASREGCPDRDLRLTERRGEGRPNASLHYGLSALG